MQKSSESSESSKSSVKKKEGNFMFILSLFFPTYCFHCFLLLLLLAGGLFMASPKARRLWATTYCLLAFAVALLLP
jgi:hypothetical protein